MTRIIMLIKMYRAMFRRIISNPDPRMLTASGHLQLLNDAWRDANLDDYKSHFTHQKGGKK
ncbi:hypothetical protein [Bifidobacterium aquikefiri]|uniref:hypothetical protein n=1 Tax=Bifidobacterium aquikefiri TaxID=1653207 RepID=UPI0039EA64EF